MPRIIHLFTILFFIACHVDKGRIADKGKSRIEQVNDRPYRDLRVDDELETSINDLIRQILLEIETLENLELFYLSEGEIIRVDKAWDSSEDLIDYSYEIWRTKDISATIAIYPSFSQNSTAAEQTKIYVIEVESRELTGTCRMFFDNPKERELTELSYTDRN